MLFSLKRFNKYIIAIIIIFVIILLVVFLQSVKKTVFEKKQYPALAPDYVPGQPPDLEKYKPHDADDDVIVGE